MANKLFLVCATLSLCVLLTNASIYRTVVELHEDDATNQIGPFGPQPKCQREFQQEEHLRACQNWIRKQVERSPFVDEEQWGPQQKPTLLEKCCDELRQEEPECVCPTLKEAATAVNREGQYSLFRPLRKTQIFQTAKNLPSTCELQEVGICSFTTIPFVPPY